ncbi:AraC family transcriptional regulator [Roseivirga pacifica]|uniref:Transcriptional regulator, AraC family n=1 Tax=Roseivirga pacifica TaxID=1267423 RepID=A0A1I0R591_9BACT|nr:AraC family transcriptional regulator [Roseivirga pacifica]RKQ49048.1 AraC family transcriptional regulator [Roseivirga pacifica]SEW35671.1 transcriptional regulator, AraC family [Roseivirga pacifica]
MELSQSFYNSRRLESLVENQTTYAMDQAEMHVFETHQEANQVLLQFHEPVLASMIVGKKVMHLRDHEAFEFLPGESLILPSDELMCIDFPDAELNRPTKCLAMAFNHEKIDEIVEQMNLAMPKVDSGEWRFTDYNFHFTNDMAIHQLIHKLLFLFTENHPSKSLFVEMSMKELIVRILQAESREIYNTQSKSLSNNNRLAFIIRYIRENLHQPLTVEELSKKAYMSESNFHRVFKQELGISPVNFINNERLKLAASLLKDPNRRIKEVYMECGFNSLSYFNRLFKRTNALSPKEYQIKATRNLVD